MNVLYDPTDYEDEFMLRAAEELSWCVDEIVDSMHDGDDAEEAVRAYLIENRDEVLDQVRETLPDDLIAEALADNSVYFDEPVEVTADWYWTPDVCDQLLEDLVDLLVYDVDG